MKYLIVKHGGIELPIIFSEIFLHSDMVGNQKVVAAGFCLFTEEHGLPTVICWGKSYTLNRHSRGEIDEKIIMKHNNG